MDWWQRWFLKKAKKYILAPHLNLPRKQIFKIFSEALSIAELFIETGCEYLPLPGDLFTLSDTVKPPDKPSGSSSSSMDDPKITPEVARNNSYLAIELDDGVRFFDLPQKVFPWDTDDECKYFVFFLFKNYFILLIY